MRTGGLQLIWSYPVVIQPQPGLVHRGSQTLGSGSLGGGGDRKAKKRRRGEEEKRTEEEKRRRGEGEKRGVGLSTQPFFLPLLVNIYILLR